MTTHRGKIRCNGTMLMLSLEAITSGPMEAEGWHWPLPSHAKRVSGAEEHSHLRGKLQS